MTAERHRLELGVGDEGEGPLGADDEPAEDLERGVGIEERAQPVAGRVLDLELAADALSERAVRPQLIAQLDQPGGELWRGGREARLGIGCGGVDDGSVREHERQRADGLVGVGDDATAHPA